MNIRLRNTMLQRPFLRCLCESAIALCWISCTIHAAVIDSSASGFTVRNSTIVSKSADEVYTRLLEIGKWWDSSHTFSRDSKNLSLEPVAGGCFCEKLADGGSVRHLTVVFVDPGKSIRLVGALGPLQPMAVTGSMTWSLAKTENGTMVEMTYAVGGYRPGGLQSLAPVVDRVLLGQLMRLRSYAEGGNPEGTQQKK